MLNKNFKKHVYWSLSGFGAIALSTIFFFCIYRSKNFFIAISGFTGILMPFIYGGVIAYLLAPFCGILDRRLYPVFKRKIKNQNRAESMAKGISVAVSMIVGVLVIIGLCYLVVPQVAESISSIVAGLPRDTQRAYVWVMNFLNENSDIKDYFNEITQNSLDDIASWIRTDFMGYLQTAVAGISDKVISVAGFFKNLIIGSVAAVYFLAGRQKFCAQSKKIIYAFFNVDLGNAIVDEVRFTNGIFGGFIRGKILDSLIIGVLCFIVMSILKWPYPVLISVIIGVTNIIPFFGPFIGAVPSTIIILTVSPIQSIYFIIFIIILQQFDGNILGPKILGETTGLSGFWVLFSILLFGGLFGFVGMIIGVPVFAVIYRLFSQFISYLLRKKSLPEKTTSYEELVHLERPEKKQI